MTREIPLTRGLVALVDDEDYERVMASGKWHAQRCRRTYYARRATPRVNGKQGAIGLHTFLTGWPMVDHADGNGLNNQRENLRPATHRENAANRRLDRDSSSGRKGVKWDKGRWRATITVDGDRQHLGMFSTADEAARAYDAAAREAFGEFAWLNFPDEAPVEVSA